METNVKRKLLVKVEKECLDCTGTGRVTVTVIGQGEASAVCSGCDGDGWQEDTVSLEYLAVLLDELRGSHERK